MTDRLNAVKDSLYEAEGLLELLQLRPDRRSALAPLILKRIDEARNAFAEISAHGDQAVAPLPSSSETPDAPETVTIEEEEDETPLYVAPEEEETVEDTTVAEVVVPTAEVQGVKEVAESGKTPEEAPAAEKAGSRKGATIPAFCLNDRFRFRRSLFGGSDAEFNAALAHLSRLDSYAKAKEYFLVDRGLDPDDEDVADFMEIIKTCF